ncbi:heavy metal translocating P-type ATPase [Spirochaeta thermophila]|uniref:P-type Zn(2+) transporter n=1 Tax=Winmispira thermophila (strain ATCC 49972 / DSM 6192 / RI 19.B1) TaxID=665571 RepID=E0RT94_WINT6|nr:heavy metal translocating P-type ATPase [Spirochaeta thermophila]ADN02390.1 zinc-transporting ATPase [Spirochaeta thermophila DSM 6192]
MEKRYIPSVDERAPAQGCGTGDACCTSCRTIQASPPEKEAPLWPHLAAAGGLLILIVLGEVLPGMPSLLRDAGFLGLYLWAGLPLWRSAVRSLVRGGVLDEFVLMSVATLGALLLGAFAEAAAVAVFYQLGEALQDRAVRRARDSITALLSVMPDRAHLVEGGSVREVRPEEVRPGQVVLVRPGERIPVDGVVRKGRTDLSLAVLTGESLPVAVEEGDEVQAGALNLTGVVEVEAVHPYAESSIVRIRRLVEEARERKGRVERFFTRFARVYTPLVVSIAAVVALVPPLLGLGSLARWGYRALVLLVISCPCALVVGIPLVYMNAMGVAAARGVLFKGGAVMDALARVSTVVFDKTGTLTRGVFALKEVEPAEGVRGDEVLEWAARAEAHAAHPVAEAVRSAYRERGGRLEGLDGRWREVPGRGVVAEVLGRRVVAGSDRLLHDEGIPHERCVRDGGVVEVAVDGRYVGRVRVEDAVREDAKGVLAALGRLGVRRVVVLTGDTEEAVQEVAGDLCIREWKAGLFPEDKVREVARLVEQAEGVVFVGDGVNDAAVLARADVGIAMGAGGTQAASESADVVLMEDSLHGVVEAVRLARKARVVLWENVVLILGLKLGLMVAGVAGLAGMWEAVIGDVGTTLLAVLNAVRAFGWGLRREGVRGGR